MAYQQLKKIPLVLRVFVYAVLAALLTSCAAIRSGDHTATPANLSTAVAQALKATEVGQILTVVPPAAPAVDLAPPQVMTATPAPVQGQAYVIPLYPATDTYPAAIAITPTPKIHPMDIEGMRARAYPGSEITIHEELERGANYARYYASYESDGLTIYGLLTIPDGETPPTGWPAIVFNHGYIAPEVYRTTERYIAYVDALARSEYIVFRID
jgi:hypothetical protein